MGKYKNQFILGYIDDLMTAMGKEYPSVDKIRFRNKDLAILPKLFEENIRNIKKTFEHTVPKLFFDVYDMAEYLLLDRRGKPIPKRETLLKEYELDETAYRDILEAVRDELTSRSNYEVTTMDMGMED